MSEESDPRLYHAHVARNREPILDIRSVDKTAVLAVPGALAVLAGADYVANGLKPIPGRRALAELNKAIKNIDQHPTRLIFGR
jgi:hypothetical protein